MRILAIGAHLDDVELACGGTIAQAVDRGHDVRMTVLSESDYTGLDGTVLRTKAEALREGRAAALVLGVSDLVILDHPTMDIPYHSSVVRDIEMQIQEFQPDMIFTHWAFDTHQAHQGTALSTISAARRQPTVFMYEPIFPSGRSYIGYRPQLYVDISTVIDKKLAALKAHEGEFRKYGMEWIDAVEARARHRGFESGHRYAESFEVLRMGLTL